MSKLVAEDVAIRLGLGAIEVMRHAAAVVAEVVTGRRALPNVDQIRLKANTVTWFLLSSIACMLRRKSNGARVQTPCLYSWPTSKLSYQKLQNPTQDVEDCGCVWARRACFDPFEVSVKQQLLIV